MARINRGRQRITLAKIQNDSNLQVTFSKRRTGLFKKSNEIVTLCGAEMLLIINSPRGKAFSYGHPSVEEIADRFFRTHGFSSSTEPSQETLHSVEANPMFNIRDLNAHLMAAQEQLEVDTRRAKEVDQALKAGRDQRWWEGSIEEMTYQQLIHFNQQLENVKVDVAQKMYDMSNPLHLLASTRSVIHGEGTSMGNVGAEAFARNNQAAMDVDAPPNFGGTGPMGRYYMGQNGDFRG